jgi:hypothetical protein
MQLKLAAAQNVLNSRIKVDDTMLRRRQTDMLPRIIAMLKEEKEQLALEDARRLVDVSP